ncbi:MAG: type II toxin-antitoxin system RelE/ParE family toxin [Rubrivivax sp.]|nr:type II toxin-antitoxin system RelE/ParE family toxin [Rubrivivax sp.]
MKLSVSEEALADAEQAVDWYVDQGAWTAAVALQVEIGEALAWVLAEPGIGTPGPMGVRILPVHRFPVSLVYRVEGDDLRVIAVAAQRRRPGHWAGRR